MIVLYFCLLGAVWGKMVELEKMSLTPKNIPKFPFDIEKHFEVIFKINAANGILNKAMIDTMVIHVRDPMGSSDTALFDFGFKDSIDSEFIGMFMRIPKWDINTETETIRAVIKFTKYADYKWLEIYHINADTRKERRTALSNLKEVKPLYHAQIVLIFPQRLEMLVNSVNTSVAELTLGMFHTVKCWRHHGVHNLEPNFVNLPPNSTISGVIGRVEAKFKVAITDHGMNLTCRAGSTEKHVTLNILHGPTGIELEPNITSTIGNGSSVNCRAANGYPIPISKWHFVGGPKDAEKFYIISYDRQSIYFTSDAPNGSMWEFQCLTWNTIKGKRHEYYKTFKLYIRHVNQNQTGTMMEPPNENGKSDKFDKEGNYSKFDAITLRVVVNKQGKDIVKLKKQVEKQTKEINKLQSVLTKSKSDVSKLYFSLKRLIETQDAYNSKLMKMKRYIDERIMMLKKELGNSNEEGKHKNSYSTEKSQIRSTPIPMSTQPILWKITDVVKMRKWRKEISKIVYLNRSKRKMIMSLYFNDPDYLRLKIQIYPTMNMLRRRIMKGFFNITIADAKIETSNIMTTTRFEIGMEKTKMDVAFEYIELFNRQILQSDEIVIKLLGFYEN